jgi:hypothetical protein
MIKTSRAALSNRIAGGARVSKTRQFLFMAMAVKN